jgi:ferredoxin
VTDEVAAFSVMFTVSDRTVPCAPDQFVLAAALAAGLKLPFVCRQGICGTCKSRLISGEYEMKHKGGIRPAEIESGMFLPCCSKPLSNLVVEK